MPTNFSDEIWRNISKFLILSKIFIYLKVINIPGAIKLLMVISSLNKKFEISRLLNITMVR